ncbi:MAG: acyl carrier protein [Clostridiales bacterium]|jgi:acyl carrier protein|nr:acyl carrier protein [Clostridiales bacterium]HOA33339.1 phosphopantetheine-binding protein [Clostridiales bacterium]HOJ36224.1 phosphopantetheine-binding protein [Clostridiales bacterium]HOL78451.1 phosphopantetheine-binding protein [Clostridiales bacterium]HPP68058.1 phosphopantetheine-binding protein [Clostridiales bacterium]
MKERILKILLSNPKIQNVTPESNLVTDFGLSSLDLAEIVCDIEDEFDIEIPEKDLVRIKTLQDIYDYIDTHA